jgi:hypothetical protein
VKTECRTQLLQLQPLGRREVVAEFTGGTITSDAGGVLLREVEERTGLLAKFVTCFDDHRDPDKLTHPVLDLLKQRVFGLCLGYEDLNDHETLRRDPLLAVLVGKDDPAGQDRAGEQDRSCPLAGKSTLNRLELSPVRADAKSRYKKIVARTRDIEDFFVEAYIALHPTPPEVIELDLDATDDPVHGHQLGRFFHGYYDQYCFLPLYIFCGMFPLCAKLRPADIDAAAGALKQIQRIVARLRRAWPGVKILIRGDSGFCRDNIMTWCEANDVFYLFGLAKNQRLLKVIGKQLHEAQVAFEQTGQASRVFHEFEWSTKNSWSSARRVIAKAEHLAKGTNPRFVVTNLLATDFDARTTYEDKYCARGEMENRIKEQQLCLFADRTSCATLRANQLRLWFSTLAYLVLAVLREHGLKGTELATARCDTLRTKLLKIGAVVTVTFRKVWLRLSSACPFQTLLARVLANLRDWRSPQSLAWEVNMT